MLHIARFVSLKLDCASKYVWIEILTRYAQFGVQRKELHNESSSAPFSSFTCGKRTPDASLSCPVGVIFLSSRRSKRSYFHSTEARAYGPI